MGLNQNALSVLTELEKILKTKGWSPTEEDHLTARGVKWKPDRILERSDGKKMAIELEQEVNIPRFLVRIIDESHDRLQDTEIVIMARRNTLLDLEVAETGLQKRIPIFANEQKPRLVLDPDFPSIMSVLPPENSKSIHERKESNKTIPYALIVELEKLDQIEYSGDLKQFAHDYERNKFDNKEEEHQFVHEFLIDRFGKRFGVSFFEGLNTMYLLNRVSQVVCGKREQFLHSFQTFLVGSVIIDKHYKFFNECYSSCFKSDNTIKIDVPWFFASLFHDVASPLEKVERMGPVGALIEIKPRGLYSIFSPRLLGCLFESLKCGPVDPEWEPLNTEPGKLASILTARRFHEHGVMGALNLMSSAGEMSCRALATVIWPASLAIAVHSSSIWPNLVEQAVFPVRSKRFPLILLLQLCDNLEEWGRESYEKKTTASLLSLDSKKDSTTCNIWVDKPARAIVMNNRNQWITQELFKLENFEFECVYFRGTPISEKSGSTNS